MTLLNHSLDAAVPRPSACPGLLRIVAARDGGICRIKLPGGRLDAAQARAIAAAATACAGGVLEATNRANLQIRGVLPGKEAELIERLLAAGLGAASAGGDDVRNLMLSPAAGHDPQALIDTRPLAAALLARLESEPRWHALSPKFAVQLDGGEALAMLDHPHDLWLAALPGAPAYAFGLAGCPPRQPGDAPALAAVPAAQAAALVFAVLELFLDCAAPEQTRMRQLLETLPAAKLLARLRERHPQLELRRDAELAAWRHAPAAPLLRFGVQAQHEAGLRQVGAQAVLGRLDAAQLAALAGLSERHGDATLRLTPWQGVLLPNVPADAAAALAAELQNLGLLGDPAAPLARLVACTGQSGCARALAETKADARRLAELLPAGAELPAVHLSGCPRSCASAQVAPYTLLATAPGRYRLLARAPGVAGFGRELADHLTIEQAAARLAAPCPEFPA